MAILGLVRSVCRRRQFSHFTATAAAAMVWADQVLQSPILGVVLVEMSLHTKNQPDISINVASAPFIGFLVPTLAPNLS